MDIIDAIKDWAKRNEDVILRVFEQRGGWEGWMQVELALYLARTFPKINVRREVNVYSNNPELRADILFADPTGYHVIELKCESLFQDVVGGATRFAFNLKMDLAKVYGATLEPEYLPAGKTARIWCVGITCDPRVADATENYNWDLHKVKREQVASTLDLWYDWRDIN